MGTLVSLDSLLCPFARALFSSFFCYSDSRSSFLLESHQYSRNLSLCISWQAITNASLSSPSKAKQAAVVGYAAPLRRGRSHSSSEPRCLSTRLPSNFKPRGSNMNTRATTNTHKRQDTPAALFNWPHPLRHVVCATVLIGWSPASRPYGSTPQDS